MQQVKIKTDYIKLGQFLKFVGCILNGCEAKTFLLNNEVLVNGIQEDRRGKKLVVNDEIKINNQIFKII